MEIPEGVITRHETFHNITNTLNVAFSLLLMSYGCINT